MTLLFGVVSNIQNNKARGVKLSGSFENKKINSLFS